MRDISEVISDNIQGVLYEYRNALKDGAVTKARRIWEANPDLHARFVTVEAEVRGKK